MFIRNTFALTKICFIFVLSEWYFRPIVWQCGNSKTKLSSASKSSEDRSPHKSITRKSSGKEKEEENSNARETPNKKSKQSFLIYPTTQQLLPLKRRHERHRFRHPFVELDGGSRYISCSAVLHFINVSALHLCFISIRHTR